MRVRGRHVLLACACLSLAGCWQVLLMPEQRALEVRDPGQLPRARVPELPPPPTVSDPQPGLAERRLSLDEAIRIGLENSKVVRVLAGVTVAASGKTIYDPAIDNTVIDQERGRFDPFLDVKNTFDRVETPFGVIDETRPERARIDGTRTDGYHLDASLSQTNVAGGTATLGFTDDLSRFRPGEFPLNPENRTALTLSYTQPLLQGGGVAANLAPVVVARINTERSYFQLKDAMQESVRGVVEAYWALVFARADVWAREQQVKQGEGAFLLSEARKKAGIKGATLGVVSQARAALATFRANLIAAEANQLQREAALRNILGLAPSDGTRLVPVTPPSDRRRTFDWQALVRLAEERRPDLIELKLIIEADEQLLTQKRNQALPRVDAELLYRWNGLEGRTPAGARLGTGHGEFTDWVLGVNFSVPLGMRTDRAALRQQELILRRDWANLDQGLHAAVHSLADSTRNLASNYDQFVAFKEAREAARINLEEQRLRFLTGGGILLDVLQAIAEWGNSLSAEAQALTQYNTDLATLERQTGTILETHGVYFFEERYAAVGPCGRLAHPRLYPEAAPPGPNAARYPAQERPAENFFDLTPPLLSDRKGDPPPAGRPEPLPPARLLPPREQPPPLALPGLRE